MRVHKTIFGLSTLAALAQATPDYTQAEALDGTALNRIALTAKSNLQRDHGSGSGSCDFKTANTRLEWFYISRTKSLATY